MQLEPTVGEPWLTPAEYWPRLAAATVDYDPPFGVVSVEALEHNTFDMLARANGTTIRVASKSVRSRGIIDSVLALPGYSGVLAYTLPEALWLASEANGYQPIEDIVVGYPTADRAAIRALGASAELAGRVTIMVDSIDQLDFVDSVIAPDQRASIRVCLELDASWDDWLFGHIGVRRSPVHTVEQARSLARTITERAGFTLVGVMGYEAQIAGLVNDPANKARGALVRYIQGRSAAELADRRGATIAAIREFAELEFVNAGGTGSLESSSAESAVTEVAAGSGLFGPHLFDDYRHFTPAPAAAFALSVVRKPRADIATLLGGGWIASGPPALDRLPKVVWPSGLRMEPREMAGEVQTPLIGEAARALRVGDRVWLRHTKAGEISEHLQEFLMVKDGTVVDTMNTYRGDGQFFL